jgi:uncharacterized membrane protein
MSNFVSEVIDGLWENFPAFAMFFLLGLLLAFASQTAHQWRMKCQQLEQKLAEMQSQTDCECLKSKSMQSSQAQEHQYTTNPDEDNH